MYPHLSRSFEELLSAQNTKETIVVEMHAERVTSRLAELARKKNSPEESRIIDDSHAVRSSKNFRANNQIIKQHQSPANKLGSLAANSFIPKIEYEAAVSQKCSGGFPVYGTRPSSVFSCGVT